MDNLHIPHPHEQSNLVDKPLNTQNALDRIYYVYRYNLKGNLLLYYLFILNILVHAISLGKYIFSDYYELPQLNLINKTEHICFSHSI